MRIERRQGFTTEREKEGTIKRIKGREREIERDRRVSIAMYMCLSFNKVVQDIKKKE